MNTSKRDFPLNTNPLAFERGLVLRTLGQIEGNEYGLQSCDATFYCMNQHYKRFVPKRGLPANKFRLGDDVSKRVLNEFDFLGKQASRFTRNGFGPGIGLLEIALRGAVLDSDDADAITEADISISSTPATASVNLYLPSDELAVPVNVGGYAFSVTIPHRVRGTATIEYQSLELTFHYCSRTRPALPRFLTTGDFDPESLPLSDAQRDEFPLLPVISEISAHRLGVFQVVDTGTSAGSIEELRQLAPPAPIPIRPLASGEQIPEDDVSFDYRPFIKYKSALTQFNALRAGSVWDVTETGTVGIAAKAPPNIETVAAVIPDV